MVTEGVHSGPSPKQDESHAFRGLDPFLLPGLVNNEI